MGDLPEEAPLAVAISSAIRNGEIDTLQRLLKDDAALATARIVDSGGVRRTLLHIVADWPGHFPKAAETAAVLIEAGADVNARVTPPNMPSVAETPLHWAASSNDVQLIDALLDGGSDIEADGAVFTGGTPMSDAVVFAQWNAARRLLERGARTTLWQSAALGLLDRVQEHLAENAPPTMEITNAFWHACRGGQQVVAQYLLDRGADMHWIGHQRKTPLDAALESSNQELIEWLKAHKDRP